MNTNNVNSPKRRFRSFEGEWEQRKLGNIASMHARIGWQNLRTSEFLDNGDYYLITGTDFLNGRINFEKCHYVNKERYQQDKKIQVGKGSILITKDGTLGKVALVTDLNKPATLNAGVFNVVVKVPSINETYLYQYLAAPFLMDYVSKRATGGTIKHLNQGILVDFPVDIPSYKEQVTIGQFLVCLDNAVTLHQHKLDKLKDLKKAYLTEMFPAEGERVPKRRFPGFEGEWEEKKLSEVVKEFIVPMRDKPKEFSGNIPWTRIDDIEGKYISRSLMGHCVSLETVKRMNLKVIPEGSLIVSASATFGTVAIVKNDLITNQTFIGLVPKHEHGVEFLYYLFQSPKIRNYMKEESAGSTIFYISKESFEKMEIDLPDEKERKLISKQLRTVDSLITLQQQKLDKLNDLKKAYLNELFV